MPCSATVYKVMIASPSDVDAQREVVKEIIAEWNAVNFEDRRIVLLPVCWETHSSPSMEARPQEVINRQVLANCDLLVAIFWTRLGTPTGAARSGTVEEIEEHLKAGKPAMLYFSSAPRPESLDGDQYRALLDFKAECRRRGLVEAYDTPHEFRAKFTRQLALSVRRDLIHETGIPHSDKSWSTSGLSDTARALLLEASQDATGTIQQLTGGLDVFIRTNGKIFGGTDPREKARWEAGLSELVVLGLIEPVSSALFKMTLPGYEVADLLAKG